MRKKKEKAKKTRVSKAETEEVCRGKAGCDGDGGVPKLSTDPCQNRCI